MEPVSELPTILLADDEPDDVYLIQQRLRKAGVENPVIRFRDGDELVGFLQTFDKQAAAQLGLLLLDLKMPMMDGFDVLKWLKENPQYRQLPVAVITSSGRPNDHDRARHAGADEVYEKFPTVEQLGGFVTRATDHPFDPEPGI